MRVTKDYVFFWGGVFSQWHTAPMNIDGIEFVTCEQYMMYQKAVFFGDQEIADRILKTDSPKEQKELGRMVKNFNKNRWDNVGFNFVYRGNYAKFSQNDDLYDELMNTDNRILVEASPSDQIWGIGMAEHEKGIENPKNWKGQNLLGFAITLVKHQLKSEGLG